MPHLLLDGQNLSINLNRCGMMSRASFPETFPPRREKNTVPLDLTLCEADQRSTDFPGKQALLAC